ncbi:hypothetical protein J3D47_002528 [Pseudomonas laurylsulfativorans]|nr:hypothetical protein [Pseudomonas laurylsulfativorans]MCP1418285.1 hypothetical protein [Pseudomonas laurylsulfativorans]
MNLNDDTGNLTPRAILKSIASGSPPQKPKVEPTAAQFGLSKH